ncbi:hypothetical protein [Gordonia westfalica]|nr:hypothetical protein [Gordonia westfalica]SDT83845.1 hypothetical protein SAMN04488548_1052 [Gordonia westfalica]
MQNAETAAWGRAIVAALAADTKKGVASSEEVRNRQQTPAQRAQRELAEAVTAAGMVTKEFAEWAMTTRNVDLKTAGIAVLVPLTREVQEKGKAIMSVPDHDAAQTTLADELGAQEAS